MGLLRNFIDISGITPESDLPDKINGQLLEFSEVEHFYIPEDKPGIKNIYQMSVKVEILSTRTIKAPLGRIIVLDGVKKIKILYTGCSHEDAASLVDIELPFNTFVDIPKEGPDIDHVNIFIADAYFKAIDSRKLYSFILYMIDVGYDKASSYEGKNRNLTKTVNNANVGTFFHHESTIEEEPEIKITSQALNEVSLSSILNNTYNNVGDLLVDIDSEYL
jgi:hypothetical protein